MSRGVSFTTVVSSHDLPIHSVVACRAIILYCAINDRPWNHWRSTKKREKKEKKEKKKKKAGLALREMPKKKKNAKKKNPCRHDHYGKVR